MASLLPEESSEVTGGGLQLRRWSDPAIIAIAFIALASGFGQYGAVAALGDVSKQLGHLAPGGSIADKVGLSGTSLGVGLAIIRLASLGSLPLIGIADRLGRRPVILGVTIAGLALTVVAAASPGYWWFVAIFAFGRPLLSATNALAGVMSAEETGSRDRSAAVALVRGVTGWGPVSPRSSTAWRRRRWGSAASSRLPSCLSSGSATRVVGWRSPADSWWLRPRRIIRRRCGEPSGLAFAAA